MAPEHKNLQILEQETPDKDKTFEELDLGMYRLAQKLEMKISIIIQRLSLLTNGEVQKLFSRTENKLINPKM